MMRALAIGLVLILSSIWGGSGTAPAASRPCAGQLSIDGLVLGPDLAVENVHLARPGLLVLVDSGKLRSVSGRSLEVDGKLALAVGSTPGQAVALLGDRYTATIGGPVVIYSMCYPMFGDQWALSLRYHDDELLDVWFEESDEDMFRRLGTGSSGYRDLRWHSRRQPGGEAVSNSAPEALVSSARAELAFVSARQCRAAVSKVAACGALIDRRTAWG